MARVPAIRPVRGVLLSTYAVMCMLGGPFSIFMSRASVCMRVCKCACVCVHVCTNGQVGCPKVQLAEEDVMGRIAWPCLLTVSIWRAIAKT